MIPVDANRFETIAGLVGDTLFAVTPYFHLHRKSCDVFADNAANPQFGAIVPHVPYPDVYLFGANALGRSQRGVRPLWRVGVRQKIAIYFAEKLEMDEIGTNGQEVYLQACPNC